MIMSHYVMSFLTKPTLRHLGVGPLVPLKRGDFIEDFWTLLALVSFGQIIYIMNEEVAILFIIKIQLLHLVVFDG